MRAWAALPTLHRAGLRAIVRVNTRNSGFTCDQHTMPDTVVPKTQTTSPLAAHCQRFSPRWSAMWALHHLEQRPRRRQSGGIAPRKGATRRRHAARRLRMAQTPTATGVERTSGPGEPGRSAHERQKPGNRTQGQPDFRYKTLPAHPPSPHVRYKTLPAHPPSPHVRYKTLPARPKWLNLALFLHAGRVLYRSDHQEAEQGEFCTEREAELGLATTAQHALLVRKAPEEPQDQDAAPAGDGKTTARQISHIISHGHF